MSEHLGLPPAATFTALLTSLTETDGHTLDTDTLTTLTTQDPDTVLAWAEAAGRVMTADYQLRLLAHPITQLREDLADDTCDLQTVASAARQLSVVLEHRARLLTAIDLARADLTRAYRRLPNPEPIPGHPDSWVEVNLVCALDPNAHTVLIPDGAPGPWYRTRVAHWTMNALADACRGRRRVVGPPIVRRHDDVFDLLTRTGDGQVTVTPLYPDADGYYLLTSVGWFRPPVPAHAVPPRPGDPVQPAGDHTDTAAATAL